MTKFKRETIRPTNLLSYRSRYRGPFRGYTPFLLLTRERSGSTWLQHLLHSHPDIYCHIELLNPVDVQIPLLNGTRRKSWIKKLENKYRSRYPEHFLKHFFYCGYRKPLRAVGFKCHYPHLKTPYGARCTAFLLNIPDLKIIHLVRRNGLKRYLSLHLARQSNIWSGASHEERVTLDPGKLESYFRHGEALAEECRHVFRNKSWLDVFYEDLVAQPKERLAEIQAFLDVPEKTLSAPLLKQERRSLRQAILNYQEIEAALSGTPWESYLVNS